MHEETRDAIMGATIANNAITMSIFIRLIESGSISRELGAEIIAKAAEMVVEQAKGAKSPEMFAVALKLVEMARQETRRLNQ